jgi:hypothetical protein
MLGDLMDIDQAERIGVLAQIVRGKRHEEAGRVDAGVKFDDGKIQADLLLDDFPMALMAVAEVATFGAEKYTRHGWITVPDARQRYKAALMRHLLATEKYDDESDLTHLAHALWNLMAIVELEEREQDGYRFVSQSGVPE